MSNKMSDVLKEILKEKGISPRMTDNDLRKRLEPGAVNKEMKDNPFMQMLMKEAKEREEKEIMIIGLLVDRLESYIRAIDEFNYCPFTDPSGDPELDSAIEIGTKLYNACAAYCRMFVERKDYLAELRKDDG